MLVIGVLLSLTIVVLIHFFWNCWRKKFFLKGYNTLPGPKILPFIGNSYIFLRGDETLDIILKMTEDYSSPFQFWMGSKLFIGIYDQEDVKTILHSRNCIDKTFLYKFFSPVFGMGLITAPVSVWTQMRTIIAPTFSSHMLRSFFNIFVKQSIIFTQTLETIVNNTLENSLNGNEIILLKHISICTWTIACDSLMGIQLKSNQNNQYVEAFRRFKDSFSRRSRNIFLFSDVIFNLTALGRRQKEDTNLIHSLVDEIIRQRVHELNNPNANENNKTQRTFFDVLMKASHEKDFTREEIHDNVITMLVAASDTNATVINFVIFMLANFPKIQEKVYEELLEIYGTETIKSVPIKYDDLQYMHYLDRVIKETIRLFPPAPLIGRQVTNDLQMGEITLLKGTNIVIGILKMHRNEKYWPNPLVFDPDRFLPENIKNCQSYIPFSDGLRNCIGMKYAMISIKVILATLVRTFVFKTDKSIEINEIKLKFDILLSTIEPLKVKIEKRPIK